MTHSSLLREIERCRHEMVTLSRSHGLNSSTIIQISKRLDDLLNLYETRCNKQLISSY